MRTSSRAGRGLHPPDAARQRPGDPYETKEKKDRGCATTRRRLFFRPPRRHLLDERAIKLCDSGIEVALTANSLRKRAKGVNEVRFLPPIEVDATTLASTLESTEHEIMRHLRARLLPTAQFRDDRCAVSRGDFDGGAVAGHHLNAISLGHVPIMPDQGVTHAEARVTVRLGVSVCLGQASALLALRADRVV